MWWMDPREAPRLQLEGRNVNVSGVSDATMMRVADDDRLTCCRFVASCWGQVLYCNPTCVSRKKGLESSSATLGGMAAVLREVGRWVYRGAGEDQIEHKA